MDDLVKDTKVSPTVSKISMLLSAIFMGNVGLFVTFLGHYSVLTIIILRGIFGTIFLTLFMVKSRSFSKEFLKESFKLHWKLLIISGLIYPFIVYFYFFSITIYGYAIAAFLLYTSGIFVLIFIILSKMEKVSKITIISFILAIIGVAIIMEVWKAETFSLGLLIGLLSGFTLAIFVFCKKIIYNKRNNNVENLKVKGDFDIFLAWWHTLFLVFIFLPIGLEDLPQLNLVDLILALLLGLIPTALAFVLHNVGTKNDKGGNILILAFFEPVVATINTIIFLKIFSIYTIIGGTLILIANIIVLKYSSESYLER
jgi:drug/metabolite transporter (DMT)-like permease